MLWANKIYLINTKEGFHSLPGAADDTLVFGYFVSNNTSGHLSILIYAGMEASLVSNHFVFSFPRLPKPLH